MGLRLNKDNELESTHIQANGLNKDMHGFKKFVFM